MIVFFDFLWFTLLCSLKNTCNLLYFLRDKSVQRKSVTPINQIPKYFAKPNNFLRNLRSLLHAFGPPQS